MGRSGTPLLTPRLFFWTMPAISGYATPMYHMQMSRSSVGYLTDLFSLSTKNEACRACSQLQLRSSSRNVRVTCQVLQLVDLSSVDALYDEGFIQVRRGKITLHYALLRAQIHSSLASRATTVQLHGADLEDSAVE